VVGSSLCGEVFGEFHDNLCCTLLRMLPWWGSDAFHFGGGDSNWRVQFRRGDNEKMDGGFGFWNGWTMECVRCTVCTSLLGTKRTKKKRGR